MFSTRLVSVAAQFARTSTSALPAASSAAGFSSFSALDFRKEYGQAFAHSLHSGALGLLRAPGAGFAGLTVTMSPTEKVNFLFDELDANKDGVLSLSDVLSAADKIGMSPDEAAALFASLDTDGDGCLTRVEFSEIGATDLTSLEGIKMFVANSLSSVGGKSTPAAHTGRWGVDFKPEKEGGAYDNSL
jgi:hypothetical protein